MGTAVSPAREMRTVAHNSCGKRSMPSAGIIHSSRALVKVEIVEVSQLHHLLRIPKRDDMLANVYETIRA